MKRNKLIEAMGKIEDRFILEADEEVSSKKTKIFSFGEGKKWIKSSFVKTAVAACLILSVVLPNVSEKSAYALQAIPGLGRYPASCRRGAERSCGGIWREKRCGSFSR